MFETFENILNSPLKPPPPGVATCRIAAFRHAPVPSCNQTKEVRPSFLRRKVATLFADCAAKKWPLRGSFE
jgi:hypothetical protein